MRKIQIRILRMFRMEIFKKINLELAFLLLIVVGYTVFSAFAIPLNIEEDSRIFAVPYRLIVFAISLFIIFKNRNKYNFKNVAVFSKA
jgi:hydrogenase-4 membrane subunit HyfE